MVPDQTSCLKFIKIDHVSKTWLLSYQAKKKKKKSNAIKGGMI